MITDNVIARRQGDHPYRLFHSEYEYTICKYKLFSYKLQDYVTCNLQAISLEITKVYMGRAATKPDKVNPKIPSIPLMSLPSCPGHLFLLFLFRWCFKVPKNN